MDSQRLLNTFLDLVRIPAPPGKEGAVAAYCAEVLRACGCNVEFDDAGEKVGSDTGNLYAVLPGTAPGSLIMAAHLDCVQPCEGIEPVIADGVIRSAGDTILGADDKAGVAAIIEAVRCLAQDDGPHAQVKIVFSISEELGCLGAKYLSVGQFEQGEPCYVFDDEDAPGAVFLAAPFHYTFSARFTGKASHAGVAPEKGASALEAASIAIARMRERGLLGAVGEFCASNIGTVHGGSATNVVAPDCVVTGECRAIDEGTVAHVRDGMDEAMREAGAEVGVTVDVDWTLEYRGFELGEEARAVRLFKKAAEDVGLPVRLMKSVGGTDANMYVARGVEPVVLSVGMTDFHSVDESLKVADLEDTARLAIALAQAVDE